MFVVQQTKSLGRIKWWKHFITLSWKSYLQRQRRWRILLTEVLFAAILFGLCVRTALPIFLTPTHISKVPSLTSVGILKKIPRNTYLAYAPNTEPYNSVMAKVSQILNISIMAAEENVQSLGNSLYTHFSPLRKLIDFPVTWVVFEADGTQSDTYWKLSIRTTPAKREDVFDNKFSFLAIQIAVSEAILERVAAPAKTNHQLILKSMPESDMMREESVRFTIAWILLYFTIALMPPVLETTALVVQETNQGLKRALCLRSVDFSAMYFGWLSYAFLTAVPICVMGSIVLIFIFRWLNLTSSLFFIMNYQLVMLMMALNMAMFHFYALNACVWCTLMIVMQTFLAELLIYNKVDFNNSFVSFILHVAVPPLGLVNGFNDFALLQTGGASVTTTPVYVTNLSWLTMASIYFLSLMMLQRTLGGRRSIRGQQSWKSILFMSNRHADRLRPVYSPSGKERENLQEVDDLVGKAVSFSNVSKTIMGRTYLAKLNFDIYRGEYTLLYSERTQKVMLFTLEDLITGLTSPDTGTINILGQYLDSDKNLIICPHMLGYCHRASTLMADLTVQEHIIFFIQISIWSESNQYIEEYEHLRLNCLLQECDLTDVKDLNVSSLSDYYQAQLCWALALLLEPRIIFVPTFIDSPLYTRVIVDKILKYKSYLTIIQTCNSSIQLGYADRVFIFNHHLLTFGGTPDYMFFSYGRDYRIRLMIKDDKNMKELMDKICQLGGIILQFLGTLLVVNMPVKPTAPIAELLRDITDHSERYGVTSITLSLADSEEVCRRVIVASQGALSTTEPQSSKDALQKITSPVSWTKSKPGIVALLNLIGRKIAAWHKSHLFGLGVTIICSVVTGILMGQAITVLPSYMAATASEPNFIIGTLLTIEELKHKTILLLKSSDHPEALSIAQSYIVSETNADHIAYTALNASENLFDYLMYQANHAPQEYVNVYSYAMQVDKIKDILKVEALYSHMYSDTSAAARSIARVYTSLIRHYTQNLEANILIIDQPIFMEIEEWFQDLQVSPMLIQVLMILMMSHITLIPSFEYGLIRNLQVKASRFSPWKYWICMFFWDMLLHCMLIAIVTGNMIGLMYLAMPWFQFRPSDLVAAPTMFIAYGWGCIPQGYIFSLGSNPTLNLMLFVIFNTVFGQSTILSMLYKNSMADYFYSLSPQFSMAYSFYKIKYILTYNAECMIMTKDKNLCVKKALHKCCPKCGVLQKCFQRTPYFSFQTGVLDEVIALFISGGVFFIFLLLWEYQLLKRCKHFVVSRWLFPGKMSFMFGRGGITTEHENVIEKVKQLKRGDDSNTFGNGLLVNKLSTKRLGTFSLVNISFGIELGKAFAISGIERHGRSKLCEALAGYKMTSYGDAIAVSKWSINKPCSEYAKHVSLFTHRSLLPHWMEVRNALEMLAELRGIPKKHVKQEVTNYIDALELTDKANIKVLDLKRSDRLTVHFAATVIGAPAVVILDEYINFNQRYSVRQTIYVIVNLLKQRGHAILSAADNIRIHLPVSDRVAILLKGCIFDVQNIEDLITTYSKPGFTVVLHLKNEINVQEMTSMLSQYFTEFYINDVSEVLINVQIIIKRTKENINDQLAIIFEKMELLQQQNREVYSYIVTTVPVDYVYNSILLNESLRYNVIKTFPSIFSKIFNPKGTRRSPDPVVIDNLQHFEPTFDFHRFVGLPWSVIFQR